MSADFLLSQILFNILILEIATFEFFILRSIKKLYMFVALYSFQVIEGLEDQFEENWRKLTELIYEYEGSFGSRLHISSDHLYIAYAQWPSKEVWAKAGKNLPPSSILYRTKMKEACSEIKTIHELEMVNDYLKNIQ